MQDPPQLDPDRFDRLREGVRLRGIHVPMGVDYATREAIAT